MTIALILSNAIFIIICVVLFLQHQNSKKSSASELERLQQKHDKDFDEMHNVHDQMRLLLSNNNKKIETLNNEISAAKNELVQATKDKESELKLRMEAEKQIVLAIQKADDIQHRMQDWKAAQEAAMKDSQDAIVEVGEDLYHRIISQLQEENQNLLEQINESIAKINHSEPQEDSDDSQTEETTEEEIITPSQANETTAKPLEVAQDLGKKLNADFIDSLQDADHISSDNYFTANDFEADKSKLFLCESAFLQESHIYFFDFKACSFLNDYTNAEDRSALERSTIQKLDKYIAYLSNPKYLAALLKVMESKNIAFESNDIVVVVPSHQALEAIETIGYLEKIENNGIKVATFDELIDLTASA